MDWGLFEAGSPNPVLRRRMLLPKVMYCAAIENERYVYLSYLPRSRFITML